MSTRKLAAQSVIKSELTPLAQGRMMQADPREVPLSDVTISYAILNHFEKVIDKRKKLLKPHLMSQAETHGDATDKGGTVLAVGEEKVVRERRLSSEPNEEKLKALLETSGIPILDCFDEVKAVKLNPSKLQYLIDIGKLKKDEVEGLRDESFALKVDPGPELKEALLAACGAVPDDVEDERTARSRKTRR
jgi:hypothetical protein